MAAGRTNASGKREEGVEQWRARCERCQQLLDELNTIHMEIDPPDRTMQLDEPDWIGSLRKICVHVVAITCWEICADIEHVLAVELRAAYEQMSSLWKHLPAMFRPGEIDGDMWTKEARNGALATYDHPTPQNLMLPPGHGGFGDGENSMNYRRLAVWMGQLAVGYGPALRYLASVLGVEGEIDSRVLAVAVRALEGRL